MTADSPWNMHDPCDEWPLWLIPGNNVNWVIAALHELYPHGGSITGKLISNDKKPLSQGGTFLFHPAPYIMGESGPEAIRPRSRYRSEVVPPVAGLEYRYYIGVPHAQKDPIEIQPHGQHAPFEITDKFTLLDRDGNPIT